jgi:hypothetical protein
LFSVTKETTFVNYNNVNLINQVKANSDENNRFINGDGDWARYNTLPEAVREITTDLLKAAFGGGLGPE